jgi:hypothetical protein
MRIYGIPNRWVFVFGYSCFCVLVEVFLNRTGYFHWAYWWWNVPFVPLIIVFGYGTFFAIAAWVYDMNDDRKRQVRVVGGLALLDAISLLVFGPVLGWI